ncbi:ferritin-like domain-containing protein [Sphingomonas sp. RIT328]|uniref:ferritin-like domain-containing protein n=1 Tax=Sphingomonas sp. RIT328 TaxID=1470591 RepID=UPI0004453D46|nr:ferritin-like domain-containing protein [Sphingomonas sp. RIT328]EZP50460.1 hypothetical protein BW41_03131 [Sphingomonas sp. RIT328]
MREDAETGTGIVPNQGTGLARRHLLAGGMIGASLLALHPSGASAQSQASSLSSTSADQLNFVLNIEYLLNQYYRIGVLNIATLEASRISGSGTPGLPIGGRKVTFAADSTIAPVITEIAKQQGGHIDMLRAILRTNIVAQPAMNIAGDESGAFTQFARYAGIVGPGEVFDPYASERNLLVGGYILGETMQRVLRPIVAAITDPLLLEPLCGLLGTHAYYSGMLREALLRAAQDQPDLFDWTDKIAAACNNLSGQPVAQGIRPTVINGLAVAGDAPSDAGGAVAARSPAQTLNILYIARGTATAGGFFPAGVNGAITTSAA